jgi:hypothetical protein
MIEISDPAIRREIQARLERQWESGVPPVRRFPPSWTWHLMVHAAHIGWLLVQTSG